MGLVQGNVTISGIQEKILHILLDVANKTQFCQALVHYYCSVKFLLFIPTQCQFKLQKPNNNPRYRRMCNDDVLLVNM